MDTNCPRCGTQNTQDSEFCKKCGTQIGGSPIELISTQTLEIPREELTTGSTFANRYKIVEELGRGGMGRVYKAIDTKIDETVALKLVRPEIASDKKTLERLSSELKIARKITHKNVGKMFDINEESGTHYITMEYISGQDLKGLMRQTGQLEIGTSLSIVKQVCEGLSEAHKMGIVHRDLKPANIMIDREGNAHIMDFGIARSVTAPGITVEGAVIGTPGYMAPEQMEGKQADQRSDIYSLGIFLFEMLTNRLPFEGDTPISIAMKQKNEKPPNPRDFNPQISEPLGLLIQKCLVADPDNRIQKVDHILDAVQKIEKALSGDSDEAIAQIGETRMGKRRAPFVYAIGILLLAGFFVAGYLIVSNLTVPEKEEPPLEQGVLQWENSIAVLPFRDQSPEQDQEHICTGLTLAINNRLTQLGNLKVISLSAVMRYKNREMGTKQVGQELEVEHILDGTILREGNRIRIMGELIEAKSGVNLWSDVFEGEIDKVFDVYDQVSQKVAEAMKLKLAPDAVKILKSDRPDNMEAYEYYLKAMTYFNTHYVLSRDEKDFDNAIQMFDRALALDPNYALAYAGLAWAFQHHYISSSDPKDFMKVMEYMQKAYELDPENPLALACKSWVDLGRGDGRTAFENLRKAMSINPNIAELNFSVGVICRFSGLSRTAIKYLKRAHELDPYYLYSLVGYAANHFFIGEMEKASPLFEKAYAMGPDDPIVAEFYSAFCIMKGDFSKAQNIMTDWEKNYPESIEISDLKAYLFAAKGQKEMALQFTPKTYWFAYVYAELGMAQQAVAYIKKYLDRQVYLPYLKLENQPIFAKLQGNPGFKEILAIQKKAYEERLSWAEGF